MPTRLHSLAVRWKARLFRGSARSGADVSPEAKPREGGGPIPAECHSDDRLYEIPFDARPWLAQASDAEILALARAGWGGDYPADTVALYMADQVADIAALFTYLEKLARRPSRRDQCGFDCHVEEEAALAWLKDHRPALYQKILEEADDDDADEGSS